jgi:hypothetical protein
MAAEVNRRNFLKTAALAAGPALISARGANQKVNIGWIGVGTRGNAAIEWLHTAAPNDVAITAVCDTYQGYIARAKDRVKTVWGNDPATYVDYRDLLADRNVDAVFIMTPEHLHHDMPIAALRRGSTFTSRSRWRTPSKRASTLCAPGNSPAKWCRWARRTAVRRSTRRPRN